MFSARVHAYVIHAIRPDARRPSDRHKQQSSSVHPFCHDSQPNPHIQHARSEERTGVVEGLPETPAERITRCRLEQKMGS